LKNTSSKYLDLSKFHSKKLAHLEPELVNSLKSKTLGNETFNISSNPSRLNIPEVSLKPEPSQPSLAIQPHISELRKGFNLRDFCENNYGKFPAPKVYLKSL
jgi:hypothetical protein